MKISISKTSFGSLLALTFVLGIGFASTAYWLFIDPNSNDQTADSIAHNQSEASEYPIRREGPPRELSGSPNPIKEALKSLDDLAEIKSSFERGLTLRIFLADADEAEVIALLAQTAGVRPNTDRHTWHMSVVQRLAQLNPQRALAAVLEMQSESYWPGQLVAGIFREWAQSNLDEAVSQAGTLDENWKESALRAIVEERSDLADDVLRSIARDLGNEKIAVAAILQHRIQNEIENPAEAWNELVIELQDDRQHIGSIAQIATAWVENSGLSVLDQISQSLTNFELRQHVLQNVLVNVAHSNPAEALKYALTIENDQYHAIARSVASTWASLDPQSALAAASSVEKKSQRKSLEESIVWSWAENKPREILDEIDSLPVHVQSTAISSAMGEIALTTPKEAALLVTRMKSGASKTEAAFSVANSWARQDHQAAIDWILNDPAIKEMKPQLLNQIMYRLTQNDPQFAMDVALQQPIKESDGGMELARGMELNVISFLTQSDLDKAIELLPQVREGPTRVQAYSWVSAGLIRNGDVSEALDMVQQLAESDRLEVYTTLVTSWAWTDPEALLNSMDRFPSREVKSKAAMALMTSHWSKKNLTESQLAEVEKLLTEEDSKALKDGDTNLLYLGF